LDRGWQQKTIDWEQADRDEASLARQLDLVGLSKIERAVLLAVYRHGEAVRVERPDGIRSRSEVSATMRVMAAWAGVAPRSVHKAKEKLVELGVLMYRAPRWVASWSACWSIEPLPDPAKAWDEAPRQAARAGPVFPAVPACSRAPKNQEEKFIHTKTQEPKKPTQEELPECAGTSTVAAGPSPIGSLLGGGGSGEFLCQVAELRRRQVGQLTRRLIERTRAVECRAGVPAADRLADRAARRIAEAVCDAGDGAGEDLEGVFGSLVRRVESGDLTVTPAAYLVGCAKRRRWV